MALEKRTSYDQRVLPDGHIEVRRDDQIWEDGVFVAHSYHRHVLHPGASLDNEDARTTAIAQVVHTPEVIAAFWEAERLRRLEV